MKRTADEVKDREVEGMKAEVSAPRFTWYQGQSFAWAYGLHCSEANSGGGGQYFLSSHTRKTFCMGVHQALNYQLLVAYIASDDSTLQPLMT